jgi:hypothetical protein
MTTSSVQFDDAVALRQLPGLSRADVLLVARDDRHWFIRKAARDRESSARLRRQAVKQQQFAAEFADFIRTPRILDEGEVDGRYYFDMEFVRGTDGATFLRCSNYAQIANFSARICEYLTISATKRPLQENRTTPFDGLYAKLCEVQAAGGGLSQETLSNLFLSIGELRHLDGLQPTFCHGDLTLENMVIDERGAIWVVDLLDAPFEHYWQDIAKLHQDLAGEWYLMRHPPIAKCVLEFVSRQVLEAAERLDPAYRSLHPLFVASTFIRIIPYTRDAETLRFIQERVDHFAELASRSLS